MKVEFGFEIELRETVGSLDDLSQVELLANRLYEAGCDDATMSTCEGVITLSFDREAETIGQAIDSAMSDIRRAGLTPGRLSVDEFASPIGQ